MQRIVALALIVSIVFASSCRSTRKIQTAINKKDSTSAMVGNTHTDSMQYMKTVLDSIKAHHIDFETFSAKIAVDYVDADDKKYNLNANLRMKKDSAIWISVNAIFGIEALRVFVTKDSVKLLNKQDKEYTARPISFLTETTSLPLDLSTLQDLLIGNPVFLDSNIVSYTSTDATISLLNIGDLFKNLLTVAKDSKLLQRSKLDDVNAERNRTGDLTYGGYENSPAGSFATQRKITIAEKKKLDIKLDFKQYSFNETLTFPFSIPKNYIRK